MKTAVLIITVLFQTLLLEAQNKVVTETTTIENFISFTSEYPINEKEQHIYIALQLPRNSLTQENLFQLEYGLNLLGKKLTQESSISLGTYGSYGSILLPKTRIEDLEDANIKNLILSKLPTLTQSQDGINLAYTQANITNESGIETTVLLLRNATNHTNQKNSSNTTVPAVVATSTEQPKEPVKAVSNPKIGGAIALTALTILPEILEIIKD